MRKPRQNGVVALIDLSMLCTFVLMANVAFLHEEIVLRQSEIVVTLPSEGGGAVTSGTGNALTITLRKDGRVQADGKEVTLDDLAQTLRNSQAVRIATDRDAPAEALLRLEHVLSKAGILNVTFLVEGKP